MESLAELVEPPAVLPVEPVPAPLEPVEALVPWPTPPVLPVEPVEPLDVAELPDVLLLALLSVVELSGALRKITERRSTCGTRKINGAGRRTWSR